MKLMIDGKEAVKGQEVVTSGGEKTILTDWLVPCKSIIWGAVSTMNPACRRVGYYLPGEINGSFI